jgi:hypothetical protein
MIGYLLVHYLLIAVNYNKSQSSAAPFFLDCRGLTPFSFYGWTTYTVSTRLHRKHIRCPAMDICEPHRKHLFLYCCIYSALHSNGSYPIVACIFAVAECVYQVVALQWVYMSQYFYHLCWEFLHPLWVTSRQYYRPGFDDTWASTRGFRRWQSGMLTTTALF